MAVKKLFVNLPVKNLDKPKDFFTKLGFDGRSSALVGRTEKTFWRAVDS